MTHFLEGCKVPFPIVIKQLLMLESFISKEKILPCKKTKQTKFREIYFRSFVDTGIVKICDELNLFHAIEKNVFF